MLNLGETFPNFQAGSTQGKIDLYQYLGSNWGLLVSHPADFTPVCTTELSRMAQLTKDFAKRNIKILCISVDRVEDHNEWIGDIMKFSGCNVPFPLLGDHDGHICKMLGMLDEGLDKKMQTVRAVYVISPDKKVAAVVSYPASVGRNLDEVLRLIDALKLTSEHNNLVCPADWKSGQDVLVKPGEKAEGEKVFEMPSGKDYLKYVKDPTPS